MAILIVILTAAGCWPLKPRLEPRPAGLDGSARWAYDVGLPRASSALAADAVLVGISDGVMPDGRLVANLGEWVLSFSSFIEGVRIPITMDHTWSISVGSRTSPGRIRALGSPSGPSQTARPSLPPPPSAARPAPGRCEIW